MLFSLKRREVKIMNIKKILIGGAMGALMLGALAASVFAAPPKTSFGTFVNAGSVPTGSKLVINITYKVTNDEDSGNVGYWALDNYNKQVQVWQVPDGSFYAVARYDGKWQTFAGALSPGAGVKEGSDAKGTFQGGYTATFTATSCTPTTGNIGSYDFGGTKADILLGTYGAGQTGSTPSFSYLSYCTGVAGFTQPHWGWTYHYRSQDWNNYDYGTTGDIVTP